jgi:hypothetical protein
VTGVFSNPAQVVAGQKYALVLKSDSPSLSYRIAYSLDSYLGLDAWALVKSGSNPWVGFGVLDLNFATYVTPPPDTTAPTTTATLSPEPNEHGWNNSATTVSLSADDQGGSGIDKITYSAYSASGAQIIAQTDASSDSADITLDQEGTTTLTYFATDKAGNVEDQKTLTVNIDKTAPTVSSTNPSNNQTGVASTANISMTFTESGSGIDPGFLDFGLMQVKPTGNVSISGSLFYGESSKTATFVPSNSLAKGLYRATIGTGVRDMAGNHLSKNYTWTFATAGPPSRR